VVKEPYLDAILRGVKLLESRFSRRRLVPFHVVAPGDIIWFKMAGGPVRARGRVDEVKYHENLTPEKIERLKFEFQHDIMADEEYWLQRMDCRYATFIWLTDVEPVDPFFPKIVLAGPWRVLRDREKVKLSWCKG